MQNEKMIQIMSEVGQEVVERSDLIEKIAVALLTGKNLFILGDTGQAKSYAVNRFRSRITGARQFERLLSKQTDEEQLFGRLDLGSLIPGNVAQAVLAQDATYQYLLGQLEKAKADFSANPEDKENWLNIARLTERMTAYRQALAELHGSNPQVITTGKIPESHICFLDEMFKANDGILNALLTALNERKYTNEGYTVDIPVISFFAASNEIPDFSDSAESILRPLYDRLELKVITQYVKEKQARLDMLARKQQSSPATGSQTTITLEELYAMQEEVRTVIVPDSINEFMDNILCEMRKKGIHVSDRKYFGFALLAQAKAWLFGRDEVHPSDLGILRAYLWTTPDEIEKIDKILKEIIENPLGERIGELHGMGTEAFEEFQNDALSNKSRAMVKFRSGFIALYSQVTALLQEAQSDKDMEAVQSLLSDLEDMSRQAHNTSGFTYTALHELAELNN